MTIPSRSAAEALRDKEYWGAGDEQRILDTALWAHDVADAVKASLNCVKCDGTGRLEREDRHLVGQRCECHKKLRELLAKREKE